MNADEVTRLNALARSHVAAGRLAEAAGVYQELARGLPDDYRVYQNLGVVYSMMRDEQRALASLQRAAVLAPGDAVVQHNLATVYVALARFDEAIAADDKAIAVQGDFALAHYSRGMALMMLGDFERGWAEMEWRLRTRGLGVESTAMPRPRWDGSDLAGKTILLLAEQGLGDTIQFARYASLAAERRGRVIVKCPHEIAGLVESVEGVSAVVSGNELPAFDVYCELLSLPYLFGTRVETIPNRTPYLSAGAKAEEWKVRLADERRLRVGLCWAGGPAHVEDRERSMTLADLSALGSVDGVAFYSLQKGPAAAQTASAPANLKLIDHTSELRDFSDTAGLMCNLDLVVTVDTAVAHVAGALGRPVWNMLSQVADWRWMLNRPDSPWYPTMRLFRQKDRGDWTGVVGEVVRALRGPV